MSWVSSRRLQYFYEKIKTVFFHAGNIVPVASGGTGKTNVSDARAVFNLPETCVLTEDWNTAVKTGWYMSNGANKNAPGDSWYFGFVIAHNNQYVLQEAYAFTNSSGKATDLTKYIRSCYAGTWTPWINVTVQRTVPEGAQLDYIKTLSSDAQAQINSLKNNKLDSKPWFIEFTPESTANNGGYIDFHYNGSEKDFTSRIIEEQDGVLLARAIFKVEKELYEKGNNRVYSTANKPTASDVGAFPASQLTSDFSNVKFQHYSQDGDNRLIIFCYMTDTNFWRIDLKEGSTSIQYRYFRDDEEVFNYDVKDSSLYLPLTGGTMEGVIWTGNGTENGYGFVNSNSKKFQSGSLNAKANVTNSRSLDIHNSNSKTNVRDSLILSDVINNTLTSYFLFGQHNKPSGSYTGNGSASARTVTSNGIGRLAIIQSAEGTVFATPMGGIVIKGTTITWMTNSYLIYENGSIVIATADTALNKSGVTYNYYII